MFDIQISNPTSIEIRDRDDNNINEAIQSIFPMENEYCLVALVLFVKSKLEKAGYNSNNLVDFYELENINSYVLNDKNFFQ